MFYNIQAVWDGFSDLPYSHSGRVHRRTIRQAFWSPQWSERPSCTEIKSVQGFPSSYSTTIPLACRMPMWHNPVTKSLCKTLIVQAVQVKRVTVPYISTLAESFLLQTYYIITYEDH